MAAAARLAAAAETAAEVTAKPEVSPVMDNGRVMIGEVSCAIPLAAVVKGLSDAFERTGVVVDEAGDGYIG